MGPRKLLNSYVCVSRLRWPIYRRDEPRLKQEPYQPSKPRSGAAVHQQAQSSNAARQRGELQHGKFADDGAVRRIDLLDQFPAGIQPILIGTARIVEMLVQLVDQHL